MDGKEGNLSFKLKIVLYKMNNDNLTINQIRDKFGDEFVKLKPLNMKWNEYYGYLYNYYTLGLNGKKHYWDKDIQSNPIIAYLYETQIPSQWLEKYHQKIDQKGINFAIENGNFQVANWLSDSGLLPDIQSLVVASQKGYDNLYPYLIQYNANPELIANIVRESAKSGHTNFIQYVQSDLVYYVLTKSIINGDIQAVETLSSPRILRFLGYTADDSNIRKQFTEAIPENLYNVLIQGNKFDMIQWIINNGGNLKYLIESDNDVVLIYLINNGIVLNTSDIDSIVGRGMIDVIKLLILKGRIPTVNGLNLAISGDDIDMVEYLLSLRPPIYPNIESANEAVMSNNTEILDLISQYRVYPSIEGINAGMELIDPSTLNWLAKHNLFPDYRGANIANKEDNIDALNWLAKRGIYPNI
jgi:hypothetical protein